MALQPPPSFLRHPPLHPACPLFKIFVSPPLFSVPLPFKVFQTVSPTLTQPPHVLIRHNNHPYRKLTGLNKYQKSVFDFLNPFTNISGYFDLWDMVRFIFKQLRMTFFHKIMVAEKYKFS